jgi:hypothetical protein
MKSAATGYSDFFKKNTNGTTMDSGDPTLKTPEDKKKEAIKRRLMKKRKMPMKKPAPKKTIREF